VKTSKDRERMRLHYKLLVGGILGAIGACSSESTPPGVIGGGGSSGGDPNGTGGSDGTPPGGGGDGGTFILPNADAGCGTKTCAELGWACGYTVDLCDNLIDCADEGLVCQPNEACQGGIDGPTQCVPAGEACELCLAVADCSAAPQKTRLTGRVVTPGRDNEDAGNQVGVPNAFVYIARDGVAGLPAISSGIPTDGTSCDRCEDQQDELGPVVDGAVTDAEGNFSFDERVPVGQEFALVVKAGKFRRAVTMTIPANDACTTRALPTLLSEGNPTRLPRSVDTNLEDGLALNIPRIAISTGQIDAMECVFEKMGIAHEEFSNPGADGSATPRIHLYRGGPNSGSPPGAGARIDNDTPHASALYDSLARLQSYDMIVSDCEGGSWDDSRAERGSGADGTGGGNVREYVNRGGRMFASHLSFSWLDGNGSTVYSDDDPIATGLGNAGRTWDVDELATTNLNTSGTGVISIDTTARPAASPRIETFADWMETEGVASPPSYSFSITDPRSMVLTLAPLDEEFVFRSDPNNRVQQFSFNTPYGAPEEATCGRVAYSGFHVAAGGGTQPYLSSTFPAHCTGNLTGQEKILLFMLFDLGACVGENPPVVPECTPRACDTNACGFVADGCGNVLDCGPCRPVIPT
jgi:hypothetical protein